MTGENKYLEMVQSGFWALENVPFEMQDDEVIDAAMEIDGEAFCDILDEKKKTYERSVKAVKYDVKLLECIPEEFKERVLEELGINI